MNGYTVRKGTKILVFKENRWQWRTAKEHFFFYVEDIAREIRGRCEVKIKKNNKGISLISVAFGHCFNHHDDQKAIKEMAGKHVYVGNFQ